jgi:hypothetical protein
LKLALPFVSENLASLDENSRDTAYLVFGLIIEQPEGDTEGKKIVADFSFKELKSVLRVLREDRSLVVKESASFALKGICQQKYQFLFEKELLLNIMSVIHDALGLPSVIVVKNSCRAVKALCEVSGTPNSKKAFLLVPYFEGLFDRLSQVVVRFKGT